MRKIKEVLRLKWANNLSDRKIAQSCNISGHAVTSYLDRAKQAGLSWSFPFITALYLLSVLATG